MTRKVNKGETTTMQKNTKLSIVDFKKYCDELSPTSYNFDIHNQPWKQDIDTCSMSFKFDRIIFTFNPNRICLTLGERNFFGKFVNYWRFERVKYVVFKEEIAGSKVFQIICGNNEKDTVYNIAVNYRVDIEKPL